MCSTKGQNSPGQVEMRVLIMFECRRRARHQGWTSNRNLLEWACVILYHAFITLAVVLVIVGVITVENADGPPQPQHSVWLKVGISMVWVLWAVLVGWTIATLVSKTRELGSKKFHHGAVVSRLITA